MEQRARELLALGLDVDVRRKASSRGAAARRDCARSTSGACLVLDEPTSGLDRRERAVPRALARLRARSGPGVRLARWTRSRSPIASACCAPARWPRTAPGRDRPHGSCADAFRARSAAAVGARRLTTCRRASPPRGARPGQAAELEFLSGRGRRSRAAPDPGAAARGLLRRRPRAGALGSKAPRASRPARRRAARADLPPGPPQRGVSPARQPARQPARGARVKRSRWIPAAARARAHRRARHRLGRARARTSQSARCRARQPAKALSWRAGSPLAARGSPTAHAASTSRAQTSASSSSSRRAVLFVSTSWTRSSAWPIALVLRAGRSRASSSGAELSGPARAPNGRRGALKASGRAAQGAQARLVRSSLAVLRPGLLATPGFFESSCATGAGSDAARRARARRAMAARSAWRSCSAGGVDLSVGSRCGVAGVVNLACAMRALAPVCDRCRSAASALAGALRARASPGSFPDPRHADPVHRGARRPLDRGWWCRSSTPVRGAGAVHARVPLPDSGAGQRGRSACSSRRGRAVRRGAGAEQARGAARRRPLAGLGCGPADCAERWRTRRIDRHGRHQAADPPTAAISSSMRSWRR